MKDSLTSIIIPVFNEEEVLKDCLTSLQSQSYKNLEIILVDDGSTDNTLQIASRFKVEVFKQKHQGPGVARNLGVSKSRGQIVVFLDADMIFDKDFIKDLITPIIKGKTIGTFSKNEFVKNQNNVWSICWNINRNLPANLMISKNHPNTAPVFRAILKDKFLSIGGFDTEGQYTDDWSLSRKLGVKSTAVNGAIYYHINPSSLPEVWKQARWIGKNEFISGDFLRKARSLAFYSLPVTVLIGIYKSISKKNLRFIAFKIIYDQAVWCSVIASFFGESKSK